MCIIPEIFVKAAAFIINEYQNSCYTFLTDRESVLAVLTDVSACTVTNNDLQKYGYDINSFYTQAMALSPELQRQFINSPYTNKVIIV